MPISSEIPLQETFEMALLDFRDTPHGEEKPENGWKLLVHRSWSCFRNKDLTLMH